MHEYIRVTSGHSLDSDLRYREETLHMVLIDPYPVDYEGPRDYRCTRLFLTDEAYSLIESQLNMTTGRLFCYRPRMVFPTSYSLTPFRYFLLFGGNQHET